MRRPREEGDRERQKETEGNWILTENKRHKENKTGIWRRRRDRREAGDREQQWGRDRDRQRDAQHKRGTQERGREDEKKKSISPPFSVSSPSVFAAYECLYEEQSIGSTSWDSLRLCLGRPRDLFLQHSYHLRRCLWGDQTRHQVQYSTPHCQRIRLQP